MKKRLFYKAISLLALFVLIISASAAWFVSVNNQISDIVVTTGNIDLSAKLWRLSDFNADGILDEDESGNTIATEVAEINIANMHPSEEYTYRLDIKNIGNISGSLSLYVSEFSGELADVIALETMQPTDMTKAFLGVAGQAIFCDYVPIEVGETKSITFKIRFATTEELDQNSVLYNKTADGLSYYETKILNISKITVKIAQ